VPRLEFINGTAYFVENAGAITLAPAATVVFDSLVLSASAKIVSGATAADVLSYTGSSIVEASFADHELKLSSRMRDPLAYEEALRHVQFRTSGEELDQFAGTRTVEIEFGLCAASKHSAASCAKKTMLVEITAKNDKPSVQHAATAVSFTQGASPVLVAPSAVLVDPDNTNLTRAEIVLHSPRAGDMLSCNVYRYPKLTSTFSQTSHTLVLSGEAPVLDYQEAIRKVTFSTASLAALSARSVSIVISDGVASSADSPQTSISVCSGAGFYTVPGNDQPQKCPRGRYQTEACATECKACVPGHFGHHEIEGTDVSHCEPCAAGKHQAAAGSAGCVACGAGKHESGDRLSCVSCAAGRAQGAEGQTACGACDVGRYAEAGATECSNCEAGRFQPDAGQTACSACAAGTESRAPGQAACTACASGSYSSMEGQAECTSWAWCPAGTSNPTASTTSPGEACVACIAGKFSATRSCSTLQCGSWGRMCPAGHRRAGASDTAAGSCEQCAPGSYRPLAVFPTSEAGAPERPSEVIAEEARCRSCPAGRFRELAGATDEDACLPCAVGQYAPEGQAACTPCPNDTYGDPSVDQTSDAHCKPCSAATFLTAWEPWTFCDAGKESKTRTRQLIANSSSLDGCPLQESKSCAPNEPCKFLTCRASRHANGHERLQVYHHNHDESPVHHCKVFSGNGKLTCKCRCLYDSTAQELVV
jgi:hypothetical protein